MQLVTEFLEQFRSSLLKLDYKAIVAMNMPDDITGWGIAEGEDYNSLEYLAERSRKRCDEIETADIDFEQIDVFGNDHAAALICTVRRNHRLKDGRCITDNNLRFSAYLVAWNNRLKIRHIHFSKPWPDHTPFPAKSIPDRNRYGQPDNPVRLNAADCGPFVEHLKKCSVYYETNNLEGLVNLQHPDDRHIFWPVQGNVIRGLMQYRQHVHYLNETYLDAYVKYDQPVIFRNETLACLSAYAEAGHQREGQRQRVSPLRVSYFLQKHEGEWRCRHSHWSMPYADDHEWLK